MEFSSLYTEGNRRRFLIAATVLIAAIAIVDWQTKPFISIGFLYLFPTRAKLTERERQVLSFVFEGFANKQITDRLQISETAVKASLQQLFSKTGVRTRSQLVRVALEQYRDQL